jgi:hypothetical protein
VRLH